MLRVVRNKVTVHQRLLFSLSIFDTTFSAYQTEKFDLNSERFLILRRESSSPLPQVHRALKLRFHENILPNIAEPMLVASLTL
jgi:hypothetical protein